MIPCEVARIADLIWPSWGDLPDEDSNEVIAAAYRIYHAGYRLDVGISRTSGASSQAADSAGGKTGGSE